MHSACTAATAPSSWSSLQSRWFYLATVTSDRSQYSRSEGIDQRPLAQIAWSRWDAVAPWVGSIGWMAHEPRESRGALGWQLSQLPRVVGPEAFGTIRTRGQTRAFGGAGWSICQASSARNPLPFPFGDQSSAHAHSSPTSTQAYSVGLSPSPHALSPGSPVSLFGRAPGWLSEGGVSRRGVAAACSAGPGSDPIEEGKDTAESSGSDSYHVGPSHASPSSSNVGPSSSTAHGNASAAFEAAAQEATQHQKEKKNKRATVQAKARFFENIIAQGSKVLQELAEANRKAQEEARAAGLLPSSPREEMASAHAETLSSAGQETLSRPPYNVVSTPVQAEATHVPNQEIEASTDRAAHPPPLDNVTAPKPKKAVGRVQLTFQLAYSCTFGQHVAIVGSAEQMGSWDLGRAFTMTTTDGGLWTASMIVNASPSQGPTSALQYKFVVIDSDNVEPARWQQGENNIVELPNVSSCMTVLNAWDQLSPPQIETRKIEEDMSSSVVAGASVEAAVEESAPMEAPTMSSETGEDKMPREVPTTSILAAAGSAVEAAVEESAPTEAATLSDVVAAGYPVEATVEESAPTEDLAWDLSPHQLEIHEAEEDSSSVVSAATAVEATFEESTQTVAPTLSSVAVDNTPAVAPTSSSVAVDNTPTVAPTSSSVAVDNTPTEVPTWSSVAVDNTPKEAPIPSSVAVEDSTLTEAPATSSVTVDNTLTEAPFPSSVAVEDSTLTEAPATSSVTVEDNTPMEVPTTSSVVAAASPVEATVEESMPTEAQPSQIESTESQLTEMESTPTEAPSHIESTESQPTVSESTPTDAQPSHSEPSQSQSVFSYMLMPEAPPSDAAADPWAKLSSMDPPSPQAQGPSKDEEAVQGGTSSLVRVSWSIQYTCMFGAHLALIGAGWQLGEWKLSQGLRLDWSEGDLWTGNAVFHNGDASLEYKFAVCDENGYIVNWQPGGNCVLELPQADTPDAAVGLDVFETWDQSGRVICQQPGDGTDSTCALELPPDVSEDSSEAQSTSVHGHIVMYESSSEAMIALDVAMKKYEATLASLADSTCLEAIMADRLLAEAQNNILAFERLALATQKQEAQA
eukprot:gene3315-13342_t